MSNVVDNSNPAGKLPMTLDHFSRIALAVACTAAFLGISPVARSQAAAEEAELTRTITDLDAKLFDAYNRCDMSAFQEFFTPDVEFYHDLGGVTFDANTVVENTRKNICHKVRRELLAETFKVYPVKDYGAIEEGEHTFCHFGTGKCEGVAKFLMIWRNQDGKWLLTRIVSYGHRNLRPDEKGAMPSAPQH